jgi:hypothetical protein
VVAVDVVEFGWWLSVLVLVLAGLGVAWIVLRLLCSLTMWSLRLGRQHESKAKTSATAGP